jgi:hypothetical protein
MQMNSIAATRPEWPRWSDFLRKYGLEGAAVFLLEAAGPLAVLGAQVFHFTSPFMPMSLNEPQREALANMLEDRQEALAFAAYLREGKSL